MNAVTTLPTRTSTSEPSILVTHAKQYWPAWVYKAAMAGVAVGQGLSRWEITVGSGGLGLVAMYALSYFFLKQEPPLTPEEVRAYENLNAANIANLNVAALSTHQLQSIVSELTKRAEEGTAGIQKTERQFILQAGDIRDLVAEEKREEEIVTTGMTVLRGTGKSIGTITNDAKQVTEDLELGNAELDQILAQGTEFLQKRDRK